MYGFESHCRRYLIENHILCGGGFLKNIYASTSNFVVDVTNNLNYDLSKERERNRFYLTSDESMAVKCVDGTKDSWAVCIEKYFSKDKPTTLALSDFFVFSKLYNFGHGFTNVPREYWIDLTCNIVNYAHQQKSVLSWMCRYPETIFADGTKGIFWFRKDLRIVDFDFVHHLQDVGHYLGRNRDERDDIAIWLIIYYYLCLAEEDKILSFDRQRPCNPYDRYAIPVDSVTGARIKECGAGQALYPELYPELSVVRDGYEYQNPILWKPGKATVEMYLENLKDFSKETNGRRHVKEMLSRIDRIHEKYPQMLVF